MLCLACAPARLVGPEPIAPPALQPLPVVVVLEPFFESAPVEEKTEVDTITTWGSSGRPQDLTYVRKYAQKPLFAQVRALEMEHRLVLEAVRRHRPDWRVVSTGELPALQGPVRLVRVIVGHNETVGSNRAFKSIATAFGVVIWPLLLVNVTPVHEVERIYGTLLLYEVNAEDLRGRLMRYPTQPDYAVDTRGFPARQQPYGLDVEFEEGIMASEEKRAPVLLRGFSERLAVAIVALVEGIR